MNAIVDEKWRLYDEVMIWATETVKLVWMKEYLAQFCLPIRTYSVLAVLAVWNRLEAAVVYRVVKGVIIPVSVD